jgi:hypothetical protein
MVDDTDLDTLTRAVIHSYVDKGRLVEACWVAYSMKIVPTRECHDQVRDAFFMGALHVFRFMIGMMEEDEEPTENDIRRMDNIANELGNFHKAFEAQHSGASDGR